MRGLKGSDNIGLRSCQRSGSIVESWSGSPRKRIGGCSWYRSPAYIFGIDEYCRLSGSFPRALFNASKNPAPRFCACLIGNDSCGPKALCLFSVVDSSSGSAWFRYGFFRGVVVVFSEKRSGLFGCFPKMLSARSHDKSSSLLYVWFMSSHGKGMTPPGVSFGCALSHINPEGR
jgi:hypothetical protein